MSESDETQIPAWLANIYNENGIDTSRLNLDSDAIERAVELGEEGVKALFKSGKATDTSGEHHRGLNDKDELLTMAERVQRFGETGVMEEWATDAPSNMKTTKSGQKDKPLDWMADETRTIHRIVSAKAED